MGMRRRGVGGWGLGVGGRFTCFLFFLEGGADC
jgi:hypothetical protein